MRILQAHTRYRNPGGEETVVQREAAVLRSAGHHVEQHIVANPRGLSAIPTFAMSPWNPAASRRLRERIELMKPDVVHIHNTWFALSASALGVPKSLGVPSVLTLHNYRVACINALLFRDDSPCELCVGTHPFHGVKYRCYRDSFVASTVAATSLSIQRRTGALAHPDLIVALTDFARERFIASRVVRDLVVKPNFAPDPGSRSKPPSASRVVLYVGRLAREKGVGDLIDAWEKVKPPLQLRLIGSGPLEGELAGRAVLSGRLTPDEVQQLMLESRALIFPSRWYEGMPMVLLEAMGAGIAVAWRNLGAIPEVMGSVGMNLSFGLDSASLEESISRLLDDARVDHCGEEGRKHFLERYSPEIGLVNLENLYLDVLNRGTTEVNRA